MSWFSFKFDDFALSFLSLLFEGVPFLLLGSLISGMVDVFVSSERLTKILPKNKTLAVFLTGLLGLIFPMCECGSVIVIRRFIRKGLPLSYAVTYMLGAPIVSPLVALSTYAAFRAKEPWLMVGLRLGLGYLIAVAAGLLITRFSAKAILQPGLVEDLPARRSGLRFAAAPEAPNAEQRDFAEVAGEATFGQKILLGVQSATADFLDVAFFFILGVAVCSVFNTAVDQHLIAPLALNSGLAVLTMMVLAAILALCSTTDAFVAASFTAFPYEAKLAFLVFGAMFDVKLFWLYGLIFKRRFVLLLSASLFVVIAFVCWRLGAVLTLPPPVILSGQAAGG